MKSNICVLLSALSIIGLANWGSESNVNGPDKNKTNIYGTLETYGSDKNGNPMTLGVDNISFGGIFENIPVYSLPPVTDYDSNTRALKVDPTTKYLKVDMNLVDGNGKPKIVEIRVDQPDIVWTYKDASRTYADKAEYVGMTFKAANGNERTYLIDTKKKLICHETKPPAERFEIPLEGVKKLTIEGAKPRENSENCACDVKPTCPPAPAQKAPTLKAPTAQVPDPIDDLPKQHAQPEVVVVVPATGGLASDDGVKFRPGMRPGR